MFESTVASSISLWISRYPLPVFEGILHEKGKTTLFKERYRRWLTEWSRPSWSPRFRHFGVKIECWECYAEPTLHRNTLSRNFRSKLARLSTVYRIVVNLLIIGQGHTKENTFQTVFVSFKNTERRKKNVRITKTKVHFTCKQVLFIGHPASGMGMDTVLTRIKLNLKEIKQQWTWKH